jgi:hypothetical protein
MTGCCRVMLLNMSHDTKVINIETENHGRDGKVSAEEKTGTGTEPGSGVSQNDHTVSGAAAATGQEENEELDRARRHVRSGKAQRPMPHLPRPPVIRQSSRPQPEKQPVHQKRGASGPKQEVFRKTELHTQPPPATRWNGTGVTRSDLPGAEELADLFHAGSPDCLRLLLKRQDDVADDLYRQAALVEEQIEALDSRLSLVTSRLERRLADLEERGRWT